MVSPEALEGSVVSRETRLRERKEKVRKRARERKALVYATQKRAREERGIGSIGLSHDVLREIVALAASSPLCISRMSAASSEFSAAVSSNALPLWQQLLRTVRLLGGVFAGCDTSHASALSLSAPRSAFQRQPRPQVCSPRPPIRRTGSLSYTSAR